MLPAHLDRISPRLTTGIRKACLQADHDWYNEPFAVSRVSEHSAGTPVDIDMHGLILETSI